MMRRYPHEASGGEKQRIVIATAFATAPELILFDEPTTALDVITGARILELFARLRERTGVAALYISHDLGLVSRVADRVSVLRQGRIVEEGAPEAVFRAPQHEYTSRLVAAVPRPHRRLVDDAAAGDTVLAAEGLSVRYGRRRLFRPAPLARDQGSSRWRSARGRDPRRGRRIRLRQILPRARPDRPGPFEGGIRAVGRRLGHARTWTRPIAAPCRSSSSIRIPR
jgi:ABC-type glutathione transport system ATPase component